MRENILVDFFFILFYENILWIKNNNCIAKKLICPLQNKLIIFHHNKITQHLLFHHQNKLIIFHHRKKKKILLSVHTTLFEELKEE
jgi:hypothetical protein